ncbi:MAG TPA: class I SAM-dependent methyltransferase [Vicinamibacterales bacterium]|nr:class I SAM-dependent methyltransferase [Vicinamibacterales bacterium]
MTNGPATDRVPLPCVVAGCDYCGSARWEPILSPMLDDEDIEALPLAFRSLRFRIGKCIDCGLVYLRERPDPRDLDVYYPDSYKCFQAYESRGAIMRTLARLVARSKRRHIERLMPAGTRTLLDYGCGSGTWLSELRKTGCTLDLAGTDIFEGPLASLREQGIRAFRCDEDDLFDHVAPASVGVVHLFHVIEHVPSPKRLLARLRDTLVPGGVIIGQTPNIASYGCRFWGESWNQWHVPHHFVLFSHETLARHAQAAGLEVVSVSSSLSGATQWAQSGLRAWAARRGRPFKGTAEPLYPPLILTAIPLATLEMAFGHTCHMDFVLRRLMV